MNWILTLLGVRKPRVVQLPNVPQGGNIFTLDGRHMRTQLGMNVVAMYPSTTTGYQKYVIICNLETGERFQINL